MEVFNKSKREYTVIIYVNNGGEGIHHIFIIYSYMERGSSVVECWTRNQVSPGSNPPVLPFGRLGIFILSSVAPVDSAV